ncbi:Lar family restriction alleviation protein [Allochromatium humboldtianum]|uniref:Lar family restriction alleviation protein n=1 Tax=Allochromatium humboldtianum TaxID=504901 RepID=A0A850R994_9GAMM|nr:Lar family restriction alleviation protein [Allochromatium humboldtianum]NVZ11289.1 Lar family restriction alleviation protein [Allochromatium humboldtianum]
MSLIAPCPFCAGINVEYRLTCGAGYVTCLDCDSYGPMVRDDVDEALRHSQAIKKWNMRSQTEELTAHVTHNSGVVNNQHEKSAAAPI